MKMAVTVLGNRISDAMRNPLIVEIDHGTVIEKHFVWKN